MYIENNSMLYILILIEVKIEVKKALKKCPDLDSKVVKSMNTLMNIL